MALAQLGDMMLVLLFSAVLLVLGAGGTAFWIWMLIDCAKNEPKGAIDRVLWIATIALTNLVGASVYFFARRPERIRIHEQTPVALDWTSDEPI